MNDKVIRIHVENFKSLKDFTIDLKKFNVLIGSNGSGKTNVLELFKFANLCIDPDKIPAYPFRPWSGFKNMVWSGDTDQAIHLQVRYSVDEYDFNYKITVGDSGGGVPEFLNEELNISNYLHVLRDVQSIKYEFDLKFWSIIAFNHKSFPTKQSWTEEISRSNTIPQIIQKLQIRPIKNLTSSWIHTSTDKSNPSDHNINDVGIAIKYFEKDDERIVIPSIKIGEDNDKKFIHKHAVDFLAGNRPIILLRQLNYAAIREPRSVEDSDELGEDAVGLIGKLFYWFNKNGQLPERFMFAVERLFPGWQIRFDMSGDGRILLNVYDGNMILPPSSIPNGFYKLLAILAAVEMEPKFILIDELDASLHAEIIDYVLSELNTCESHVIITTHSPLVIDAVKLEDVVMFERTESGTKCKRIKNIDMMQNELRDQGLTLSERWIYG